LRWDSLGEFLALAVALEHFSKVNSNPKAAVLGEALDDATEKFLDEKKSPSRRVNELDNRGSHFYLTLYWAQALAAQNKDTELKTEFESIANSLLKNEDTIVQELIDVQGQAIETEGYFLPNAEKTDKAMRPSTTLNRILS
jgi:isocitrate dehydrogenase